MSGFFRPFKIVLLAILLFSGFLVTFSPPQNLNIEKDISGLLDFARHNFLSGRESMNEMQEQTLKDSNGNLSPKNDLIISQIHPGDIILVRGSTWEDRMIKFVTHSGYTHVAGVVKPRKIIDILPFSLAGYKEIGLYAGRADVFTCDVLTEEQRRKIVNYITGKVGSHYNYFLVLWQISRYWLHWSWPYQPGDGSLCSTLWTDAYREAGVNLCPDIPFPSPGDLANSKLLRKVLSY